MSIGQESGQAGDAVILHRTRHWLEHVVIGLNLCPFANSVFRKNQIEYRISRASDTDQLVQDLLAACELLVSTPADRVDTVLLIHPQVLTDFLDYNDFLDAADAMLEASGLNGVLQIASFHPDYRFAGTETDDITNFTNRSPYPMLHLLREESLDKAIAAYPETDDIVDNNLATMQRIGLTGWTALQTPADGGIAPTQGDDSFDSDRHR